MALGKAGEMVVFYSWVISSDLKNFHCLCRGNMQRMSGRSGHLSLGFLSLGMQSFLSGRNIASPWELFQQHSLMLADGHCDFGHVLGRVAYTLPRQNAMSSGSRKTAAGDIIVANFIFDLNYTMCSLFLGATELNLRVSSKGKGSARFASSSVSSTQSQKSQWEMTVSWSNIILFLSTQSFLRQGD